jgi:hypothetical protein
MTKRRPAVGLEDFEKLIRDGYYYVDKTYVVKELLEKRSDVNLFTRPRRFGKTLLMDMMKCFFEIGGPKEVFEGLKISQEKELCEQYQGKYPVIFVSLKSLKRLTFEAAKSELVTVLTSEASRHPVLATSDRLTAKEKDKFQQLCDPKAEIMGENFLTSSLRSLSELLYKHCEQQVIILIDEYDVPLDNAEKNGFYNEMLDLVRGLFDQALKTNPYMKFAVMTGCLRIAKESIFTGMNKVKVYTALDRNFSDAFGYMDEEVRTMLNYLELSQHYEDIKDWYDGYQFGDRHIYCPWDVNNYCADLHTKAVTMPKSYWMNTSGNDIIRKFISLSQKESLEDEVESLINGGSVRKRIHQELTYRDLYASMDNIWSVLFMTGYLTVDGNPEDKELNLVIPNQGIREVFQEQVVDWIKEGIREDNDHRREFAELFAQSKAEEIEKQFTNFLKSTISVRDSGRENFYHAYLLGMLTGTGKKGWKICSNQEMGIGYGDIAVVCEDMGIVIEVKYAADGDLDKYCIKALEQIETKDYAYHFQDMYGITRILKYGVACYKKRCRVMLRE